MFAYIKSMDDFEFLIGLSQHKLVVIGFISTSCDTSDKIIPKFGDMDSDFEDATFNVVDVNDATEVSEMCKITSTPTFLFYKNEVKVDELTLPGRKDDVDVLRTLVTKHI